MSELPALLDAKSKHIIYDPRTKKYYEIQNLYIDTQYYSTAASTTTWTAKGTAQAFTSDMALLEFNMTSLMNYTIAGVGAGVTIDQGYLGQLRIWRNTPTPIGSAFTGSGDFTAYNRGSRYCWNKIKFAQPPVFRKNQDKFGMDELNDDTTEAMCGMYQLVFGNLVEYHP